MKQESADFLLKAREFLLKARDLLGHWPDEAGRAVYLASFHAAQAFIFEKTGDIAKTHSGVRGRFGHLTKDDDRFDDELRTFLGRAYNFKAVADYETGPDARIPPERVASAIQISSRFVEIVAGILETDGQITSSSSSEAPSSISVDERTGGLLASIPFRTLLHADWSIAQSKRWVTVATRVDGGWHVLPPHLVGDSGNYVDRLFRASGPVLAGFDFPIGVPAAYGEGTGFTDFLTALVAFGHGEWSEFFEVAETPQQIKLQRPFYPRVSKAGTKRGHLVDGLGVENFNALLRRCDHTTKIRNAACAIFWTLGRNQVGKAAIAGWREILIPARTRGARVWPFDGSLTELASNGIPVLAETYPAEAYRHVDVLLGPGMSKRRQDDRRSAMSGLPDWARRRGVTFSPDLTVRIEDGFGTLANGENSFDSLIGLLGMIEVTDKRRPEYPSDRDPGDPWEGWILGQAP
jgi:uncharacterized protein (UPF0332 family)